MMFTFRITWGAAGTRTYVLGNGSAFGTDTPPGPVGGTESFGVTGVVVDLAGVQPHVAASNAAKAIRLFIAMVTLLW
jgi:hypothetical protein